MRAGRRKHKALIACVVAGLVTLSAARAVAHEIAPAIADLSFDGQGGYAVSIALNLEALIAETDEILAGLRAEIDALVDDVQQTSATRQENSEQTASTGRMVMLIVGIVGVVLIVLGTGISVFRRQGA